MDTLTFDLTDPTQYHEGISQAASAIARGGIVVFPTETVYGLGADATDERAVSRIFEAKGRPSDNPLIVHIADREDIFLAASSVPPDAMRLAERFMPGPISIVLPKNDSLAPNVTAGLSTVAVRLPVCREARDFIRASGRPIAAPSANISGKPSPTRAEHVIRDMNGRCDVILTGYDCEVGLESTVVDMSVFPACILRPGAVSAKMLSEVLGYEPRSSYKEKLTGAPKAPGMKYTHYKPDAKVISVAGSDFAAMAAFIRGELKAPSDGTVRGAIVFDELIPLLSGCPNLYPLGSMERPDVYCARLYDALRWCDTEGIGEVWVTSPPPGGISDAFLNRLDKASDVTVEL
ncbi:MAG: threonylcarbamoyl-AMP synthase [Eubacteriales bacterium]|nr:threonylcarbamoyl-AMP synthase [Eubacteriales bacterium]